MVRINRVVTRGGDVGETSLGDGSRIRKDSSLIEAIGAVDEANAAIGVLWSATLDAPATATRPTTGDPTKTADTPILGDTLVIADLLDRIQNDLFDIGADLCVPGQGDARLQLTDAAALRLEAEIAAMNASLSPLTSFILPGGTQGAAQAHMARVIVRRAERAVVALDGINPALLRYLNRLSDHLFVLARVLNNNGAADVLWVPGANR